MGTRQYLYDRSTLLPQLFAQSLTWQADSDWRQAQAQADVFVDGNGIESAAHLNGSGVVTDTDYIHQDGLGSTVAVTNPKSVAEATYVYTPWGTALPTWLDDTREVPGQIPFGFAGQVTDQTDGLIYMHARYYDPTTGRFISRDPRAPSIFDALDRNPYAYARGNPATFRVPSGLAATGSALTDALTSFCCSPSSTLGSVVGAIGMGTFQSLEWLLTTGVQNFGSTAASVAQIIAGGTGAPIFAPSVVPSTPYINPDLVAVGSSYAGEGPYVEPTGITPTAIVDAAAVGSLVAGVVVNAEIGALNPQVATGVSAIVNSTTRSGNNFGPLSPTTQQIYDNLSDPSFYQ